MLTTIIYVSGALSLQFTDIQSPNSFFSLLLPFINLLFFIFLLWQLIFYYALNSFSDDNNSTFFDLVYKLWHIDYEIERCGLFIALRNIVFLLINAISLFVAVFYYLELFLDFVQI